MLRYYDMRLQTIDEKCTTLLFDSMAKLVVKLGSQNAFFKYSQPVRYLYEVAKSYLCHIDYQQFQYDT